MNYGNLHKVPLNPKDPFDTKDYQAQLLAEYNALRSEVVHRMGVRHQIVVFSVAVLGAVFAFDAPVNTLLAYPLLGLFLTLGWAHNDFRIGEIGEYIRERTEKVLPGMYWETHFFELKEKKQPLRYILRATIISAGGIIVGTQVIALLVALRQETSAGQSNWFVGIDIVAIALSALILHWRKLIYSRK